MFPGFSDSSNPTEIAVEASLSPFETASPLPSVEKAFHIYVNLALPGREYFHLEAFIKEELCTKALKHW